MVLLSREQAPPNVSWRPQVSAVISSNTLPSVLISLLPVVR